MAKTKLRQNVEKVVLWILFSFFNASKIAQKRAQSDLHQNMKTIYNIHKNLWVKKC